MKFNLIAFLQYLIVALAIFTSNVNSLFAQQKTALPNIVFILCDDLRYDTFGYMGNKIIKTPNIDKLARLGTVFRNHFVTTSICCVSRASIFIGQYERRHQIINFSDPFTPQQWEITYPALLRKHGYRTGFIGKFGVGNDKYIKSMAKEFDYWRGLPGQAGLFFDKNDPTHTHKTALFGNQAIEFIETCKAEQPFCLSISFNAPHARDGQPREFTPDPRDEELYIKDKIPLPKTASEKYFNLLPDSVKKSEARRRWEKRFNTPEKYHNNVKDYYRLISGIDREIGRILQSLETNNFLSNTVVIFTSDNGFFLGEHQLADKWFMYEESIRVPLIIYDPRIPSAERRKYFDGITLNIDFAPTILELATIPIPQSVQGVSLLPLLKNGTIPQWRTEFFYEHHTLPKIIPPCEGVRAERFSYIRWIDENPVIEELYDIKKDKYQTKNLINSNAYKSVLEELRQKWENYKNNLK